MQQAYQYGGQPNNNSWQWQSGSGNWQPNYMTGWQSGNNNWHHAEAGTSNYADAPQPVQGVKVSIDHKGI